MLPPPGSSGVGSESGAGIGDSLSPTTGDGLAAAGTAAAYVHALVQKDWPGACNALAKSERAKLAAASGSCERGVAKKGAPADQLNTATTGAVRKHDDLIAVDIVQPGQTQVLQTVFLKHEDALWLVVELPAAQTF